MLLGRRRRRRRRTLGVGWKSWGKVQAGSPFKEGSFDGLLVVGFWFFTLFFFLFLFSILFSWCFAMGLRSHDCLTGKK